MATIPSGLKKVGPYWHYNLEVNGQRAHGSTRASDLATARKILEEKRRELLEGQYRIVSRIPTVKEVFDQWFATNQALLSSKHLVPVECVYRRWIHPRLGSTRADQISGKDVDAIRQEVVTQGRSPRYANNILQVLRLLLNHAVKAGDLRSLPITIKMQRLQKKPRPTIPAPQLPAFLAAVDKAAQNPHVAVILRVMLGLGLRESEALGMRWEWFDSTHRTYVVGKAKGKEARVLPIPDWLWTAIHAMPKTLSE